jgi:hypothetical protein
MYLINYFIYLYNFKAIYDVTGSTTGGTGTTPFSGSLPGPVFKTMLTTHTAPSLSLSLSLFVSFPFSPYSTPS